MQKELQITKGFSLVEILLAGSLFTLMVTAFVGSYLYGEEAGVLGGNRARATLLAEEGLEATQSLRDANFTNLVDGTYGVATSSGQYILSGASDTKDIFTRAVTISSIDANRKSVAATVNWQQNPQRTGTLTLSSNLTYWQKVVAVIGNWANPNTQWAAIDAAGTNDGLKIQAQGNFVYMVRNDGTPDFMIFNVSTSSPSLVGSLALSGIPSNIAVSGNYAYVTNNSDTQELQVINIATPASASVVGTLNLPGTEDASGVFAVGTTVYLVRTSGADNEFVVIDASVPTAPTVTGSLDLGGSGTEVAVVGTLAFVAGTNATQKLQVINVAAPSSPVLLGSLALPAAATSLAAFGNTVVLGDASTLYLINVTVPAAPSTLGTFAAGGTINDISLGNNNGYAFLATASTTNELQVVDISTPATPVLVGGFNAPATCNGIAYESVADRAYMACTTDTSEFTAIQP